MTTTVRWHRYCWIVLAVAFVVRLVLACAVQHIVAQPPARLCLINGGGDAEGYWELAGKIVAGEEYSIHSPPRRVLRMPGFPLLLAIPRIVFGDNAFAARLFLVLVGTVTCGLTYLFGKMLAGDLVGLIASVYTALSPTLALFSVLFLSETAFAATILLSLIATARLIRTGSQTVTSADTVRVQCLWALVTGALIGVATYMRPTWLLVGPGLAALMVLFARGPIGNRFVTGLLICAGLAVSLAPWTYRNYRVTGHLVSTTLWSGPSLYDGLNPTANGDSDMTFFDRDGLTNVMTEYDWNREYNHRAWDFVRQNPARVVWLAWEKQKRYWSPAPNSPQFQRLEAEIIAWAFYLPLIGFAVVGAWVARNDFWLLILTAAPILYFGVLHLLFVGSLRYRMPAEYPLAVLAAIGFVRWRNFKVSEPV